MDLSGVHQIIQAFMGARELASRDANAAKNREHDAQRQAEAFKQQEKMLKMEQDFRRKQLEAETARENYFAVFNQLASGQRKLQGQTAFNGMTESVANPVRNAEGMFEFSTPQAKTEFVPDPAQIVKIPGASEPTVINSSEIPTVADQVSRMRAMLEPKTDAERSLKDAELRGKMILEAIEQGGATSRNNATIKSREAQAALDRASREKIAKDRIAAAFKRTQAGLSATSQNASVMRLVTQHDANPITKRYVAANEAVQFVNSMGNDTKNSANDIGLVYAFAKAMDPDSVVREGEYATAQRYAQNLPSAIKMSIMRTLNNEGFLSPEARANLKSTITTKAKASNRMYSDYRKTVEGRINSITPGRAGSALGEFLSEGTTPVDSKPSKVRIGSYDYVLDPSTNEYVRVGGK